MRLAILNGLFTVLGYSFAMAADPAGFHTLEIGDSAPGFRLPGVDGKDHTLVDFAKARLLAVIFTCNHCPTAQAYEDRIIQLAADYQPKGVAVVAISPNDPLALRLDELGYTEFSDSLDEMKQRAKDRGFDFPYLYDGETQKTSLAYGVIATPQIFVFDQDRKLRYGGRIDDSDVKTVTSHDARNAIDALLAGKPVPVEKTRVFGCSTKWSDKRADAAKWIEKANAEPVEIKPIDEQDLARLVRNETENLLLINVWATWCGPCVAELPELVTANRMYRKRPFKMVTISIDEPEAKDAALKLLKENHISSANYLSAITKRDRLADILDQKWQGPVPHTVLIAPGGKVIFRQSGEIDSLELKKAIVEHLGRTYANRPPK
jgi:thiol-disulfide isomerase/thioredoxin